MNIERGRSGRSMPKGLCEQGRRTKRWQVTALLAWAVISQVPAQALAQSNTPPQASSAEYQRLVDRGLAAYSEQRPTEARALFAQAHALQPGARTLRALGIADLALDNYTMAKDELEAALKERVMPLTDAQRGEVKDLLAWMQGNLGTLHLAFKPLHAEAKIDGRSVKPPEVLLAPEEHRLTISARGFVPQERTITIAIDRPMKLEISLERAQAVAAPIAQNAAPTNEAKAPEVTPPTAAPLPPPPVAPDDDGPKLWPWLGGAGAVLLVAGGTMFAFGLNDMSTVENAKPPVRLSEIEAAHDRVPWLTGVGLSLGIAGLAGIGAATVLLFTEREQHKDVAWSLGAGPTQVSLTRRF